MATSITTPTSSTNTFNIVTPSPPGSVCTPPAPRHGYSDPWEPFVPRKSARLSRRTVARTPSPHIPAHRRTAPLRSVMPPASSPPSWSPAAVAEPAVTRSMPTPSRSPRKRRLPALDPSRRASAVLTADSVTNAAVALGLASECPDQHIGPGVVRSGVGMLLTPAKTPRKTSGFSNSKTLANIQAFARHLFHSDHVDDDEKESTAVVLASPSHAAVDAALTPTRHRSLRSKTYKGISMESFETEQEDEPIRIYTDKGPQPGGKKDPAYRRGSSPPIQQHANKNQHAAVKRQVLIPGEGVVDLADAIKRHDGIVYVFRGKKIFRKFAQAPDSESRTDDDDGASSTSASRPMTRSQIKPRLLFPPAQRRLAKTEPSQEDDEEEAVTDVEDQQKLWSVFSAKRRCITDMRTSL